MGLTSLLFGSSLDSNRGNVKDGKYITGQLKGGIADAQNRAAPQAGMTTQGPSSAVDTGRGDQFRGQEMALAQQLAGVASGQQQGAGELAARRAGRSALSSVLGTATMARGPNAAGGARAAARGASQVGLGMAGQAQQAALQDQGNARSQLAQVLGQGRSQDTAIAGQDAAARNQAQLQQAQLNQQTQMQNLEARLRTMGMNDQAVQQYMQQYIGMQQAEAANRASDNGMMPSLLSAGATAIAACDARVKEDVREAADDLDGVLDSISGVSWHYREADADRLGIRPGLRDRAWGVMAQDLELTPAGATAVTEMADGTKLIDAAAAVPLLLALAARLADRVAALEDSALAARPAAAPLKPAKRVRKKAGLARAKKARK